MPTIYPPTIRLVPGPDGEPGGDMTNEQAVELRELTRKLGEPMDGKLTRSQAQMRIEALRARLEE